MRKTAILDASSAIILAKTHLSFLMVDVYNIVMPPSVFAEITAAGHPEAAYYTKLVEEMKIKVAEVEGHNPFTASGLDQGEYDCVQRLH